MVGTVVKAILKSEKGISLVETVIALGIIGMVILILLQALPVAILGTSRARAGVSMVNLATSQMESIKSQSFASSYSPVSPLPDGFSVEITATVPITYRYPAPLLAQTPDTVQFITVTVTGPYGSRSVEGYKTQR